MKCSEMWLREWVNPNLTLNVLCDKLMMAGIEVEEISAVAERFTNVVVGQIETIKKHPKADHLHICQVKVNKKKPPLQILCGAKNLFEGMKVPVAQINAVLSNHKVITVSNFHGFESQGMLCSAEELGLAEESHEILQLSSDAKVGEEVWRTLQLDDSILHVALTPNRGDCLSILGLAREISAITQTALKKKTIPSIKSTIRDVIPITLEAGNACPHYVGRMIRNVNANAETPLWMKERLRRSGLRSINAIVDVANYVMLEIGNSMHAFDCKTIEDNIVVRFAHPDETIQLLDGTQKTLDQETLVIADQKKVLAMAGLMGGLSSGVTLLTQDIFLESAFFNPQIIARGRQRYNLNSEASYRYERGVDPTLQLYALSRSTELILEICGGDVGPMIEKMSKKHLPKNPKIHLMKEKIDRLIGVTLSNRQIEEIFKWLHFTYQKKSNAQTWEVKAPAYRFDMSLPEDLIEEIARLYGYDKLPLGHFKVDLQTKKNAEQDPYFLRQKLCDMGYQEIISYSFVDKKMQAMLDPHAHFIELLNPITTDMTVMRTNLLPGLVTTCLYNESRQQERIRLFEIGSCFRQQGKNDIQETRLGGLMTGLDKPEQWGMSSRNVDFYDLKGDVEELLRSLHASEFCFQKANHPVFHPGQSASIEQENKRIGVLGVLHPGILATLNISQPILMFEINLSQLRKTSLNQAQDISKFPEIRRDLAVLINDAIPEKDIQDTIGQSAGSWLKKVFVFDLYQGKGVPPGLKSIALALIFQHPKRTLLDTEVAEIMERVITDLKLQFGAELRS